MRRTEGEVNSNNLSLKILTTLSGGVDAGSNRSKISSLKSLTNRIKQANEGYSQKSSTSFAIDPWMKEKGIDIRNIKDAVEAVKIEEKTIRTQDTQDQKPKEIPEPLKESFKDFTVAEIAAKVRENLAYRAINKSLASACQPQKKHFRNLLASTFDKMWGKKLEPKFQQARSKKDIQQMSLNAGRLGDVVQQSNVDDLHSDLVRKYDGMRDSTKVWVPLLADLIDMAYNIYGQRQSTDDDTEPRALRNYLVAISLDNLDGCFREMEEEEDLEWKKLYSLLRKKGDKEEFLAACRKKDSGLATRFAQIFEAIQSFQQPPSSFHMVSLDRDMGLYQALMKLAACGKYQPLFLAESADLKSQIVLQPWLILMSSGMAGKRAEKESQRLRQFNKRARGYLSSVKFRLQNGWQDDDMLMFMIGLLVLGQYHGLSEVFKNFADEIVRRPLYVDLVHIFILLVSNPCLLLVQLPQLQVYEVLDNLLPEVINFIKSLKGSTFGLFSVYYELLCQILAKIEVQCPDYNTENVIRENCSTLISRFADLDMLDNGSEMFLSDQPIRIYLEEFIVDSLDVKEEKEFQQIADFCWQKNKDAIAERFLLRMVISNYFKSKREDFQTLKGLSERRRRDKNSNSNFLIEKALTKLKISEDQDNRACGEFLSVLRQLSDCIDGRRTAVLRQKQNYFAFYRRNFERVMRCLNSLDVFGVGVYAGVMVCYFESIFDMYKLIYMSGDSREVYEGIKKNLLQDMGILAMENRQLSRDKIEALRRTIEG